MNKREFVYNMIRFYGQYTKDEVNKLVVDDDKQTFANLRERQKRYGIHKTFYSEKKNRKKANKIYKILRQYIHNTRAFLDFGGGACDMAFHLGQHMNLRKDSIWCVDVEEWAGIKWNRRTDITFSPTMSIIPNESIDVIMASHVLHHLTDNEIKSTIKEFERILSKNGTIIIQEHDSLNKEFNKLLDFQHFMYDVVLSQTTTYDELKETFYSNYKPKRDWHRLFKNFKIKRIYDKGSFDRSFYCIYERK
jgi:ubiquinone/menaquinone biosynthesis C-methylase UbiE